LIHYLCGVYSVKSISLRRGWRLTVTRWTMPQASLLLAFVMRAIKSIRLYRVGQQYLYIEDLEDMQIMVGLCHATRDYVVARD